MSAPLLQAAATEAAIQVVLHAIGTHLAGIVSHMEYREHYSVLQRLAGEGLYAAMDRAARAHARYDADGDAVFVAVLRAYGVSVADKFAQELGK